MIIGTGYKPIRSSVQAKWGILETDTIPKNIVQDYIYEKLAFENMIEGSEELKGYIYEASQFHRVDSVMEEDYKYHLVTMKSVAFDDWTHTHGGPFYVEVGKNINIDYMAKVNVSKTVNTSTGPN